MGSFSLFIGVCDSISAEVLAIHKAAELCVKTSDLCGKDILIISNSMTAVSWINGEGIGSMNHVNLIYDIREWLSVMGNVTVIYNSRSLNSSADSLARQGSGSGENNLAWDFP